MPDPLAIPFPQPVPNVNPADLEVGDTRRLGNLRHDLLTGPAGEPGPVPEVPQGTAATGMAQTWYGLSAR